MDLNQIKKKVIPVFRKFRVKKAGLFGSVVRGDNKKNSDVDILVELESDLTLLDFVGLKLALERVIGKKVDLVEYQTIKPLLRKQILSDEVSIYETGS